MGSVIWEIERLTDVIVTEKEDRCFQAGYIKACEDIADLLIERRYKGTNGSMHTVYGEKSPSD